MLRSGSSLDIWIAEIAIGYENYLNKKHSGTLGAPPAPKLSQKEMQAMIDRVRARKDENKI